MVEILELAFEGIEGFKRIYVDLPGHGKSSARDNICLQNDILTAVNGFITESIDDAPFALIRTASGRNPSSPNPHPLYKVMEPDPSIRPELLDNEIWAFDNVAVVQRRDIIEKRRKVVNTAKKLHNEFHEARVKKGLRFQFCRQRS